MLVAYCEMKDDDSLTFVEGYIRLLLLPVIDFTGWAPEGYTRRRQGL